jgi:hypothetical protein
MIDTDRVEGFLALFASGLGVARPRSEPRPFLLPGPLGLWTSGDVWHGPRHARQLEPYLSLAELARPRVRAIP